MYYVILFGVLLLQRAGLRLLRESCGGCTTVPELSASDFWVTSNPLNSKP